MKQIWKKLLGVLLALSCMLALTACGSSEEAPALDPQIQSQIVSSTESLVVTIVNLSDEEIAAFKESQTEFEVMAMEAWDLAREEVGAFVTTADATVEYDGEEIVVVVPAEFSIYDADFTVIYDKYYTPTSISVDVSYPMSVTMQRAGMNTLMGIGIVFLVLIFLSFLISLFRFIPQVDGKKEAPAPAAAPKAVPVVEEEELTDDTELVAVIAAAIAAAENTSTDSFVVRSIKKAKRRSWK